VKCPACNNLAYPVRDRGKVFFVLHSGAVWLGEWTYVTHPKNLLTPRAG
jgi:hypothetical protein